MSQLLTPKQVAQAIGVSESSLKRWCDRGLIGATRTAGGHRRLRLDDVLEFLRQSGHRIVRPDLLSLPSNTGHGATVVNRAREQMREALLIGDEDQCRRIVFDLHLGGQPAAEIFDRVIAGAFYDIGDRWSCGEAEIYQERRACDICQRVLTELRAAIPPADETAPRALGGAPQCDPYTLPTAMAEIVLRQAGWRAESLGARLPFRTLAAAIRDEQPHIFWLSVSYLDDPQQFIDEFREFQQQVRGEAAIIVGGQALTDSVRRQMEYSAFGDGMQHLDAFAKTLARSLTSTLPPGVS